MRFPGSVGLSGAFLFWAWLISVEAGESKPASASEVQAAMKQGLPLGRFEPQAFKEGVYMRATQGSLSIMSQLPHPHATKVFVNWLLSREGQIHYQSHFLRIDPVFSLREDVPPDPPLSLTGPSRATNLCPSVVRSSGISKEHSKRSTRFRRGSEPV